MQGATKKTSLSLFENILHQLDNLPEWYTARHLKRQVLNYAVQNRSFLIEEFPQHLEKTNKSYYKIIEDLCIEKNAIGYAADFLIAVCRLVLQIPIVIIRPYAVKYQGPGSKGRTRSTTSTDYYCKQVFLCEADKKLEVPRDVPIVLVHNGIDFYAPARLIPIAVVKAKADLTIAKMEKAHKMAEEVVGLSPGKTDMRAAWSQVSVHLGAAIQIAKSADATLGTADVTTPATMPLPVFPAPGPRPFRKRRRRPSATSTTVSTAGEGEQTEEGAVGSDPNVAEGEAEGGEGDQPESAPKKKRLDDDPWWWQDCNLNDLQCCCGLQYNTKDELTVHMSNMHVNNTWRCSAMVKDKDDPSKSNQCPHKFSIKSNCWKHYREKHENRHNFYCEVRDCAEMYGCDEEARVKWHQWKKHQIPTDIRCKKCDRPFPQNGKKNQHEALCGSKEKPNKCDVADCGYSCRSTRSLKIHMKTKHAKPGEASNWIYCTKKGCDKKYTSRGAYEYHLGVHERKAAEAAQENPEDEEEEEEDEEEEYDDEDLVTEEDD